MGSLRRPAEEFAGDGHGQNCRLQHLQHMPAPLYMGKETIETAEKWTLR